MSRGGVRILGGALRGRRLKVGPGVRPSEARLREALFSIWQARLTEARFLDLFAGSGAVGLEALGRGAATVCFVDSSRRNLESLRRACQDFAVNGWQLQRWQLPKGLATAPEQTFDLIFADPPYAFDRYEELLQLAQPWLADRGELALEHASVRSSPEQIGDLWRLDCRRYGSSMLSRYQRV